MTIDFNKNSDGLVPAIIQDATTKNVLMLGYMDQQAYTRTIDSRKVTFYSRTKNRLWTKGEESGNFLNLVDIKLDCDQDTLLVLVNPVGPTCHTGTDTCWGDKNVGSYGFLTELERVIADRKAQAAGTVGIPDGSRPSYVSSLFKEGINKVAQKVGEEAIEVVIEAMDHNDALFKEESADLLFHYLVLLRAKGFRLDDIVKVLQGRH
ncbi:MAG TPA: bifunctional phosphoribosyl-AMP cyclohydrolase/phosphoribosyl-ATP diphosphatase HisIE [Arenibacter sp.]|nr:bifunctional phosphoribosyl-AMP cyclohydrolase/phosphoribosyl-ATP diphosphatase HisIE [Arenibacter sp.]